MYKDKNAVSSFRQVRCGQISWFEVFQVGHQYALTVRNINDEGRWLAWRDNLNEVLKLIPQDAEKVV